MIIVKDDTNVVNLKGELEDKLEFSHEIFGEKFYSTKIKINRLSNSYDILPMTISERLLQDIDFENEKLVSVVGQLRSYNKNVDNISVRIQTETSTIYGVIVGYSKEKSAFIISQLNSSDTIKKGEKVVTSGLGTYNIPNIPVGTVLSVTEKSDHLTKEVFVKPSADLSDIRVVTLVGNWYEIF